MLGLLVKLFIKNKDNVEDYQIRTKYGTLCGMIGIVSNIFIALIKIITGVFTGSISIISDGVNSLTDGAASVITVIAFKISSTPPDSKHPFGHERLEYVSGLIVSFIICIIGVLLAETSIKKIINPEPLDISKFSIMVIVLSISILVKIWQCSVYYRVSKKINSNSLKASSFDSLSDCISTGTVLISMIISKIFNLNLDPYLGLLVSLFIIFSGIKLIKETISPLLGEAPSEELVNKIRDKINSYDSILGYHDLVIHTYGTKVFVTIHVEVDAKEDIIETHEIIDNIEREFLNELNINMVIHMDPIDLKNLTLVKVKKSITEILKNLNCELDFHDIRINSAIPSILFDLVVPEKCNYSDEELTNIITKKINEKYHDYEVIIKLDHHYI